MSRSGRGKRERRRLTGACAWVVLCVVLAKQADAVPPLVTGDVPTAEKNHWEIYVGTQYQKNDSTEWEAPFTEIVYGITDRQELTFEIPYLVEENSHGFGDSVVGTKFVFVRETNNVPGIAGSFELKLPTGDESKGLGTGELDYDIRLRAQKTFGWFTGIANVGYTFVGEPEINGVRQNRNNVWLVAFAQEYEINSKTSLLSEIYWETSDEPGQPNRFAGDIGFKYQLLPHLQVHATAGKSLRSANRGGPAARVYGGIKLEF